MELVSQANELRSVTAYVVVTPMGGQNLEVGRFLNFDFQSCLSNFDPRFPKLNHA